MMSVDEMTKHNLRILFLGYDRTVTGLVDRLEKAGCAVDQSADPVKNLQKWDLTISFGFRHIIKKDVIESAPRPPINLHIGYLPFNRGTHPNFWAFYDGTPSGVTIHEIDDGIDTGPILVQEPIVFPQELTTFETTHAYLLQKIETLFAQNIDDILTGTLKPRAQRGKGTYHRASDLPEGFPGWSENIDSALDEIHKTAESTKLDKLEIIAEIERVRANNNINWMDLLRLAFSSSPEEAKQLVRRINADDRSISDLFSKLGA